MATKVGPRPRLTKERLFYSGMALLIFASVFVGFAPTWFLRGHFGTAPPLKPLVLLHGTLMTSWIALFVVQAGLISARQHKVHMRLGLATVALGAAIVVVGLLTAARQPFPPGFFTVPFLDIVAFAVLLAGGFAARRDPQTHKRLMLCATAVMLQPGVARIAFIPSTTMLGGYLTTAIAFLLATPLLAWDYVQRGRPHKGTLIGLGVLASDQLIGFVIGRNETWLRVAGWIVRALS